MQKLKGILLLCSLLPGLALAQAAPLGNPQRERLVEQLLLGEALGRDDLVDSALARLQQLDPESPEALAAEARLAIRRDELRRAGQLLNRLQRAAPDSVLLRQTRVLLKVALPAGRQRLLEARARAEQSIPDALRDYEQVLEGQLPSLDLALEYWRLRSRVDGQRPTAIANLEELARRYPGHAGVRLALADMLFAEERPQPALALLHELGGDAQASQAAAQREFQYLSEQPLHPRSATAWEAFVARYPHTTLIGEARDNLDRDRRRLRDPAWQAFLRGQTLLDGGQTAAAEVELQRAKRRLPDEPGVQGTLGLALMRLGRHAEALNAFAAAQRLEQNTDLISKWYELQEASRYWVWLEQAEQAEQAGQLDKARQLYARARQKQPAEPAAWVGLAALEAGAGRSAEAERLLLQARRLAPADERVLRGLLRLYQAQSNQRATAFLESLPPPSRQLFAAQLRDLRVAALLQQADAALQAGDGPGEARLLQQARQLTPDDPWLTYRLAGRLAELGRSTEGDALFADLLGRQGASQPARYAHALYLSGAERDAPALDSLRAIPVAEWNADTRALAERLQRRQLLNRAEALRAAGQEPAAIALLEGQPSLPAEDLLRLAGWAQARGAHEQALAYLQRIDAAQAESAEARLGEVESLLALGRAAPARATLQGLAEFPAEQRNLRRRVAGAWMALGDLGQARTRIEQLLAEGGDSDPLLLRDAARLHSATAPQQALDLYAGALRDAGELAPQAVAPRDDRALTRASRPRDDDDWLARSLRAETEALYQRENPTVRVQHDHAWRNDDVTPGLSDVKQDTTMVQLDLPLAGGRGWLRLDEVNMDAGRFDTDADGLHREDFGSCAFPGLAGCVSTAQQARGTAFALGWQGGAWSFDLGRSPQGFEIGNWLGGVSYAWDAAGLGWTLTASRRALSNSLLSYAGAVDPRTGIRWGGVTANGASLGLSYDQGGDHGIWADLGQHWLRGENVADNQRTRLMAGYYYRLIERADERLRTGLTVMHWRYAKDLGGYSLGQGGYYSPQRYSSLGVPVSYAWRNADWSLLLEGSLGWSWATTEDSAIYPLDALIAGPLAEAGALAPDFNQRTGTSGGAVGYRLSALAERRLSDHWVLGGGFTWQQSEDYAPSYAQLYLRYLFEPWQGALPLGGDSLTPYSEFK